MGQVDLLGLVCGPVLIRAQYNSASSEHDGWRQSGKGTKDDMRFEEKLKWAWKAIWWLALVLVAFDLFYPPILFVLKFIFLTLRGIS